MKRLLKRDLEVIYKELTLIIIIMFILISSLCAFSKPPTPMGESDDYMLDTISLENRLSLFVLESDLEQAKTDFPNQYEYLKSQYPSQFPIKIEEPIFKAHGWYFGTYSFSCIPAKFLLKTLNLDQSHAFVITNEILYIFSILFVFIKLKTTYKIKFITILMLVLNPAVFYLTWMSSEIMTFALVVISLVYLVNKEHKKAAFFVSLAGTLNPTIMVYGFAIIVDYFVKLINENRDNNKNNIVNIIRFNIKDIILLAICFVPSIIPFIYNYINFGVVNLSAGMSSFNEYWPRFFSYLFDLNLGVLPYFPIILIIYFIFLIIGVYKKNMLTYIFTLAFIGTIGAYSIIFHINCGMTGIARYNVWSVPIMIFFIATQCENLIKRIMWKRIAYISMILSSFISLFVVIGYGGVFPNKVEDMKITPIAEFVLNKCPYMYNPYYNTFMIRVAQITQYGAYKEPVIYVQKEGYVRKILVTPETTYLLDDIFYHDDKALLDLKTQIKNINSKTGYQYINLGNNTELKIKPQVGKDKFLYTVDKNNILDQNLIYNKQLSHNELVLDENNKLVLAKGGIIFGPYKQLSKGTYTISIKGDNLDQSTYDAAYNSGNKLVNIEKQTEMKNEISYNFKLEEGIRDIEIRMFNNQEKEIVVESITIQKVK